MKVSTYQEPGLQSADPEGHNHLNFPFDAMEGNGSMLIDRMGGHVSPNPSQQEQVQMQVQQQGHPPQGRKKNK